MLLKILCLAFIFSVLLSCNEDAYFEEYRKVEQDTWHMDDIKEFTIQIDDTSAYRMIINIRNTTDYSYSNLYMFLTMLHPRQSARRDTIECLLADPYGHWLGKGVGKIRESRFLIKDNFSFPDTGNYLFKIEQAMRDVTLEGIADVGLRIEKISLSN